MHFNLAGIGHRVGHEHGVARAVKIIAVVAEQRGQPAALGIEGRGGERLAGLQAALRGRGVYQAVGRRLVAHILYGVDGVQLARGDNVAELGFLWVLLWNDAVGHLRVKVTVGPEQVLGNEGARLGGHIAEQHGRRAKLVAHPAPELRVGVGILVEHGKLYL